MKFTLNWLKDYLETQAGLVDITETLTKIGLEVESVEDYRETLKDFIVAKIEAASPHPNAAKLQVCEVNDGSVTRQVVCGAANARAGLYVVLAREGVVIPGNGMVIKKAKIRDVESNGMLCSLEELGLAESSEGIIELQGAPQLGSPATSALGYDDAVIDIAITPNRGDCFSIYGVARDLAAAGLGTLKAPTISHAKTPENNAQLTTSVATNTSACPYFVGCAVNGVKNIESPEWLKKRLTSVGQRPISALVDVTNYLLITFGRPLHVYDIAKLQGNLQARLAKAGESLKALNGNEYKLDATMMVIADDVKALGIAGIMGGEASGCTLETKDVYIESALFDPISIANTGRKLEIISDARQRFERGVDTAFVKRGAELARDLIVAICGGTPSLLVEAGSQPHAATPISFNPEKVGALTGVKIDLNIQEMIMTSLGFKIVKNGNSWDVTVPSWRHDVSLPEDLVEEIIRIHGYEHIPLSSLPEFQHPKSSLPIAEERAATIRKYMANRGMTELCSWSFVSHKEAENFGGVKAELELLNPISSELSVMRPSLLPHLLSAATRNSNKGTKDLALFEVGLTYSGIKPDEQRMNASGLRAGTLSNPNFDKGNFSNKARELDVFDAKTDAFAVLESLGFNPDQLTLTEQVPNYYHPARSMAFTLGGKIILGYAGELHPTLLTDAGLTGRVPAFEIYLDAIPQPKNKTSAKKPLVLSPFPEVERDFAFLVDVNISAETIKRAINKADKQLITRTEVFDVFKGKNVPEGKQSIAFKVTLTPTDHTLTDAEIQAVSKAIVDSVAASTGASLRG